MKLSIIIPFHKGIHFLEDCFASIEDQGLSDFETILILDHVKEDLSPVLKKYQDSIHIKLVELDNSKCNKSRVYGKEDIETQFVGYSGVACARNEGIKAATGDYIYFLDSDDYILNGTLPLLLKEAEGLSADLTYGKRASTWFKRMIYLSSIEGHNEVDGQDEQDSEEEQNSRLSSLLRRQEKIMKLHDVIVELDGYSELTGDTLTRKAEAYYTLFVSKKSLKNVSVLGILYRRRFIIENNIQFNDNFTFYSDLSFVVQSLYHAKQCGYEEEAVYIMRKHNDPIHYPALSQTKMDDKFEEYIASYQHARKFLDKNSVIKQYLDDKLIKYFIRTYAPKLRRSENIAWRTNRFHIMQECMKNISEDRFKLLKGYQKRIVSALRKGNVKKATRIVNLHLGIKKIKKIRKNKRVFSYYLYFKFFSKMPIKENWVLCESFFGKSYSDSPKYIYEYLAKNYGDDYKFIWVINKNTKIPYHPVKVKRFSIRYCYYMARCKYIVLNVRQPEFMRKRPGTILLETWHGTPLKKLVFDQEEVMGASPLYKAQFYKQAKLWDYLVSANHFSTQAFRSAFRYEKEILEYGYPRNDILYSENKEELTLQLKKKLNIPQGKKTILYAPTWRDDEYYGRGEYKFALKLDLREMKKQLGEDYVILLRTHYYIADSLDVTGLEDFAINVSKYDDVSELYLVSDILITDYSSVFFDYANLKRPILFYTYDLEKYRDMLRGFYLDIHTEVPGPLLYTSDEVIASILRIEEITAMYQERYEEFYQRFCELDDGHASENVAKRVFGI